MKTTRPTKQTNPFNTICTYEISRFEVENKITGRLVRDLRPDPSNRLVRLGPGRVIFNVLGYDDDPRELAEIPEFVAFIRKANETRPCWIYFAHPESHWLYLVGICCCAHSTVIRRDSASRYRMALPAKEFIEFLQRQLKDFLRLCQMAGLSEKKIQRVWNDGIKALRLVGPAGMKVG